MKPSMIFLTLTLIFVFCLGAVISPSTAQTNHLQQSVDGSGWKQVNLSGFGNPQSNMITSLEIFNGLLYAGSGNPADGGQVWRTSNGIDWAPVSEVGFSDTYTNTNAYIPDLAVFKGQLYAGTSWSSKGSPGQIWRTQDGTTWEQVIEDGFNDPANQITNFTVFSDTLYVSASNLSDGLEIWRSTDGEIWDQVVDGGSGFPTINGLNGFMLFEGYLYASVESWYTGGTCQVWRTDDGSDWEHVITDGFNDPNNISMSGLAALDGFLYGGTWNDETGAQLWRSDDGTTWDSITIDGFGDPNNVAIESVYTFNNDLYVVTQNPAEGMEVWRSPDGAQWSQVNANGFGNPNNIGTLWSNGTINFHDRLYVGTTNTVNGGEIWRLGLQTYLPVIKR